MSQKLLPTVKFVLPTIAEEADLLTYFLLPNSFSSTCRKFILDVHPILKEEVGDSIDKDDVFRGCYKYTRRYRRKHAADFQKSLRQNEKLWRPIEKRYLRTLSDHFESEYPKHRRTMKAYVSIVPIYPRDLSEWSFNVSYFAPERVKEIACHEIQHFLYFKKWIEVFPETKLRHLDNPHLVWRLSELIDPVILSEHPEFKTYFTKKQLTYKRFQKIRIRGRQPTTHLAVMYRRHLKSGEPFDVFLRDIWKFALANEKVLMAA